MNTKKFQVWFLSLKIHEELWQSLLWRDDVKLLKLFTIWMAQNESISGSPKGLFTLCVTTQATAARMGLGAMFLLTCVSTWICPTHADRLQYASIQAGVIAIKETWRNRFQTHVQSHFLQGPPQMACHPLSHWNLHNFDPPAWLSWVHFSPHNFLWSRVHVPNNPYQNNPKEKRFKHFLSFD